MEQRDQALVNILERLAGEMTQQDKVLDELLERHNALAKTIESTGLLLRGGQAEAERSYDKLLDAITHYRSGMLSLVNEQDHINRNIKDLENILKITTYSVDTTSKKLVEMSEKIARIEKTVHEHSEFSSKQPGIYKEALGESSRELTRLHASTEKRLSEYHNEMARQMDSNRHEILRRLLLLDGIISSLQVLLMRTEPIEERPVWIVRLFTRLRGFVNSKIALLKRKKD